MIYFLAGLFVGATFGVLVASLCVVARRADDSAADDVAVSSLLVSVETGDPDGLALASRRGRE